MMKTHSIHLLFAGMLCLPAICGGQIPGIEQISTHPGEDTSPAVSPDGRWAAYVSDRSGNRDIWLRRLPRGRYIQVTTHPADDFDPAWAPDSRRLAFVSRRRDAAGDIWMIGIDQETGQPDRSGPHQITSYQGRDMQPVFARAGRALLFASDRSGGRHNLWETSLETRQTKQLTVHGGADPAVSPSGKWLLFISGRHHPQGDVMLMNLDSTEAAGPENHAAMPVTWGEYIDTEPVWSYSGDKIMFCRVSRDTDGDGRLTPGDNRSLWVKVLTEAGEIDPERIILGRDEIKITSDIHDDCSPAPAVDGRVLFDSGRRQGRDIWSIDFTGLFSRQSDAAAQYQLAQAFEAKAESPESLEQLLLGYRRVSEYFPGDTEWGFRSRNHISSVLGLLGRTGEAAANLRDVIRLYGRSGVNTEVAELNLAALAHDPLQERISRCRAVIERTADRATAAEAELILGDLLMEADDISGAAAAYSRAMERGGSGSHAAARAGLKMGDLLQRDGQSETARESWLSVLREYAAVPLWRERAGSRLLGQVTGSAASRIEGFQALVDQMRDVPALAAEAQLATAEVLMEEENWPQALRELRRAGQTAPGLEWAEARAKILEAAVLAKLNEDLKAYLLLEEVTERYALTDGGRYAVQAADTLFNLYLSSAADLAAHGDFSLAGVRFRRAAALKPDDLDARRGYIDAAFRSGALPAVIDAYEAELRQHPADKVTLYSLGLAYSYLGQNNPQQLQHSNALLLRSLEEDYRLIYPYRTLSYNYELLENLARRNAARQPGLLEKIGKTIAAPLIWVGDLLSGGKEKGAAGYYEKAIEVLTAALELNDEQADRDMETYLAQNLANNYFNLGEYGYRNAFKYYTYRLSLDTAFTSPLEKAAFYERAGRCGAGGDNVGTAVHFLTAAEREFRGLGMFTDARRCRRQTAFLYQLDGNYETAVTVYEELAVRDETAGRMADAERGYRNIAFNYHLMGVPDLVLSYALKAADILEHTGFEVKPVSGSKLRIEIFGLSIPVWTMDELGGASSEGFTDADEAALLYGLISRSHESLKSFAEAVSYEEKRLSLFQKRKDKLAVRISLQRLGKLLYQWHRYPSAWEKYDLSRRLCRRTGDMEGMTVNLLNQGSTAMAHWETAGSDSLIGQAIKLTAKALNRKYKHQEIQPRDRSALLASLGALHTGLALHLLAADSARSDAAAGYEAFRSLASADSCFGAALAGEPAEHTRGELLKNAAEVYVLSGQIDRAAELAEKSLAVMKALETRESIWRVQYLRARLLQMRGSAGPDSVLALYKEAVHSLEAAPVPSEKSEEIRSGRTERFSLYADAAFVLAEAGRPAAALAMAERGVRKKAADMLMRRPPVFKRERHKILWSNFRFLNDRLWTLQGEIDAAESFGVTLSALRRLREEKERLENEYRDVTSDMEDDSAVLAWLTGASQIDITAAAAGLAQGSGALVYLMGKERTLVWTVDQEGVRLITVPRGRKEIAAAAARRHRPGGHEALYTLLLKPVSDWIDNLGTLVIVPDRELWDVPFAALGEDGLLLMDRLDAVLSPSLSVYALAEKQRRAGMRSGLTAGAAADVQAARAMTAAVTQVDSLLSRTQAGESAFLQKAADADIIHLERWALHYEYDPFYSTVVLYPDADADGYIRASDFFSRDLRAGLFVLPPARNTGIEARLSFFYSLLYAGVPTVISRDRALSKEAETLWSRVFYQRLARMSPASALAEAQAALRDAFPNDDGWTSLRLLGFEGMDHDGRIRFAADNLVSKVREGQAYEQQGEFRRALGRYDQAEGMASLLGDSTLSGRILDISLAAAVNGGVWEKAADYQQRIQQRARQSGDAEGIRTSLKNLIAIYRREGRLADAAATEVRYNELVRTAGELPEQARSSREMAMILMLDRKWGEALDWAEKACSLYTVLGDTKELGRALLRKGRISLEADDAWRAREDLQKGVELLEAEDDAGLRFEIASGYQLLGLAAEKMSRYRQSMEFQEKGRDIFLELGSRTQAAQGGQYLANLYWKTGDFRQAQLLQDDALAEFRELDNAKLLSMGYATQGLISLGLGETGQARKHLNYALDLAESTGSREDQSAILKNLGLLEVRTGSYPAAGSYFNRAASMDSLLHSRPGLAYSYRNLGVLQARMGRPAAGIPLLRESIRLSRELKDVRNIVHSYYGLGLCLNESGRAREAAAVLDSGLVSLGGYHMPDLKWRLHWMRARSLRKTAALNQAAEDYYQALNIVEDMRRSLSAEAFKQGFLEDKSDLYEDFISYFYQLGRYDKALETAERAKSRSFIDLLSSEEDRGGGIGSAAFQQETALRDSIDDYRYRIASLAKHAENAGRSAQELNRTRETLQRLEQRYARRITDFQAQNPESAELIRVKPVSAADIRGLLPDSTALLEYFVHADKIYIWAVTPDNITAVQADVTGMPLEETVRTFRNTILAYLTSDQEAERLYSLLIEPVRAHIEDARHLVIIPHGILHYCPFAALQNPEGRVLLEDFSLSLAPSSTVLGYCRQKSADRTRQGPQKILAVSNPALGAAYDLPFAEREVSSLQRTFEHVTVFAAAEATEKAVRESVSGYDILHFACHAEFNPESPLFSALLLVPDQEHNGRLEAHELFGLTLNCDLVTLSACESGLGKIAGGDDIVGLSRGFIFAGAPSLVTSLWKVDDLATAVLIKRFYRSLKDGISPAEALRQAQLWVRQHVSPRAGAWAAFGLTGEFQ